MGVGLIAGTNQFQFKEKYDALKAADQKSQLAVPKKRLETATEEQKELTSLTTLLGSLKGDITSFIEGEAFNKSKIDTDGESASLTTSKGVNVKDFSIDVKQLAQKDAYQSESFSSEVYGIFQDASIINTSGEKQMLESSSFKITVADKEFTININNTDSLQSLNDKLINATTEDGDKLSDLLVSKVLDVGHDNYRLMLTSKEAGIDNAITFSTVGESEDEKRLSAAVLKKLGFLESSQKAELNSQLKAEQEANGALETILGGNKVDIKGFLNSLENPLEITNGENTFSVDKNTKLSDLDESEQNALLDKIMEQKGESADKLAADWVAYIKNTGEELNISYKDTDGSEQILSLNANSVFDAFSEEQKKGVVEFFKHNQIESALSNEKIADLEDKISKTDDSKNHVQNAKDSVFIYDGVEITRSTNSVNDLIIGAKISLKKEGLTKFNLQSDSEDVVESFKTFATNYNAVINSLATSTAFDQESKKAGALQGVSEVSRLKTELSSLINKSDESGMSLAKLGFELNEKGILSFKSSVFKKAFDEDPEKIKKFLIGETNYEELSAVSKPIDLQPPLFEDDLVINGKNIEFDNEFAKRLSDGKVSQKEYLNKLVETINEAKIDGVKATLAQNGSIIIKSDGKNPLEIDGKSETLLNLGLEKHTHKVISTTKDGILNGFKSTLNNLIGSNGTLKHLDEKLQKDIKNLNKDIATINKDIEKRYDIMAKRLAEYDAILNKYAMQGQQINAMIEAAFAQK